MTTAAVAERFHARPVGAGFMAHCPGSLHAHGDRHESLSISGGRNGRTVLHCWAGCDTQNVLAAVGLRLSDLFTQPSSGPRQEMPREVKDALADLRGRLTKRERVLDTTIITTTKETTLDLAIARALALAVENLELVQVVLEVSR
jgi:hypothetical protein